MVVYPPPAGLLVPLEQEGVVQRQLLLPPSCFGQRSPGRGVWLSWGSCTEHGRLGLSHHVSGPI